MIMKTIFSLTQIALIFLIFSLSSCENPGPKSKLSLDQFIDSVNNASKTNQKVQDSILAQTQKGRDSIKALTLNQKIKENVKIQIKKWTDDLKLRPGKQQQAKIANQQVKPNQVKKVKENQQVNQPVKLEKSKYQLPKKLGTDNPLVLLDKPKPDNQFIDPYNELVVDYDSAKINFYNRDSSGVIVTSIKIPPVKEKQFFWGKVERDTISGLNHGLIRWKVKK